jgi:2'-5' RNA ligase
LVKEPEFSTCGIPARQPPPQGVFAQRFCQLPYFFIKKMLKYFKMRRRIFIAINLPEEIKEEFERFKKRFSGLPAKWVKKENLHLTLAFLGYVKEENLSKIIETTKNVASKQAPFSLKIIKISYGPPKIFPPKMVWAIGEESENLKKLQENLKNALLKMKIPQLEEEERGFIPHITLSRIRKWEFKQMEPEERPEIDEDLNFSFEVKSIEIMESHLKRGGAEYTVLESVPLSKS